MIGVPNLIELKGQLAAAAYADPSAHMNCIGITGTNGKTSIAYHIADIFQQMGDPCGYIGTLGWGGLADLKMTRLTTPDAVTLQKELAALRDQSIHRVAIECSSHSLEQGRVRDVKLDVGIFSNLSRDHLDYHETMGQYGKAKAKLFTEYPLKLAVINTDDDLGRKLLSCSRAEEVLSYGASGDIRWRASMVGRRMEVRFSTPWGRIECHLPFASDFAIANVAAAVGAILGMGRSITEVAQVLQGLQQVPGRMQLLNGPPGRPRVLVDYAHTPDAVAKALSSLRGQSRGKLICVVGCGGDRDRGKRPEMGRVAVEQADQVWLTSDNPRSEAPEEIIRQMQADLSPMQLQHVNTVVDRRQAICQAIAASSSDDVILIAGKGHESSQEIQGTFYPFDDKEIVKSCFEEMN